MNKITVLMTLAVALLVPSSASAQMTQDQLGKAMGIVTVIRAADHCGYRIDEPGLERYYEENGLSTPQVLGWISAMVGGLEYEAPPSGGECAIARSTARSIGALAG